MPHLIIEHSSSVQKKFVIALEREIQNIMNGVAGDFDADQCKCRSFSFDEYFVGRSDQSKSSFIHITLKVLSGRSLDVRQNLSQKIYEFVVKFYSHLNLPTQRCDISIDIVEMDRDTYKKIRIE